MTSGPAARPLIPTLTSGDESVIELLPELRAALSGSGPALLLQGEGPQTARTTAGDRPDPVRLTGPDEDDPDDPTAVAVSTSGSTGKPKTVLLPASALLASASATHDRLGGAGHWLLALPAHHIAGLQVLVRCLIAGKPPAVLNLNTGFTPAGFIKAAQRVGGGPGTGQRRYTSLVPTQLTRLLTAPGETGAQAVQALRDFDAILVGGSATTPALLERAAEAGVRLVTTYGMSETCGGCVYDGVPLDGVEVRLIENDRVLLGGPGLARGYRGDPEATAQAFVTDDHGRRWFRTDDAGVRHPADDGSPGGALEVLGRLDSMIISGGLNIAPGPVEAALHRLPGVAEAVVVGVPDPEWGQRVAAAIVLTPGASAPSLEQARALVSESVSHRSAPRQLLVLESLPLRGPGKPDRRAIQSALTSAEPSAEGR